MPCHVATFSVGDTTTVIALVIFLAGMFMLFSYWMTGTMPGKRNLGSFGKACRLFGGAVKHIFSRKIFLIIKTLILDVLLQRRLYRQSTVRWLIHFLIFFPFVFRFFWGLTALTASLWTPEWSSVWDMLDKNHPATGFLFDLTGIMVLFGMAMAFIRGIMKRSGQLPGLPSQDWLALSLIGGIVVIGFILEGIRIAMTGYPNGSGYAILGFSISLIFKDSAGLTGVYGTIWYIHAILTGIFVAYLPFSRMMHIIMAPLVLAMNAVQEHEHITLIESKPN